MIILLKLVNSAKTKWCFFLLVQAILHDIYSLSSSSSSSSATSSSSGGGVVLFVQAQADTIAEPVACPTSAPLNPLVLKGKRFFDSVTGEYVSLRGVAYYPRPNAGSLSTDSNSIDFFSEEYRHLWEQDIQHMKDLGVNLIRIYAVNPAVYHEAFMCTLQDAGIYVMVGLLADCSGCNIGGRDFPAPACYTNDLKRRGQFIINEFSKYRNTLAFSAGNEVTLYARPDIHLNAPCQKKFLADMRQYVNRCRNVPNTILPRAIPIGMVNWDLERDLQTYYFNCRNNVTDDLETPEWYGLNAYQHCDATQDTVGTLAGWQLLRLDHARYQLPVPVIIAEFGCRERGFETIDGWEAQRDWLQVDAIFSPQFQEVFAGGIVFEYSAEKLVVDRSSQGNPWPYNGFMKLNYGLGYYAPVDCEHINNKPCVYNRYPEFATLQNKLAAIDTSTGYPNMNDYISGGQTPACPEGIPSITKFEWPTDGDEGLPCHVIYTPEPSAAPTVAATTAVPTAAPTAIPSAAPVEVPNTETSNPTSVPDGGGEDGSGNTGSLVGPESSARRIAAGSGWILIVKMGLWSMFY